MDNFSIGQRVKIKNDAPEIDGQFTHGKDYIVRSMTENGIRTEVEKDDSGNKNGWLTEFFIASQPSPIRTVMRRDIVAGIYGSIVVDEVFCDSIRYIIHEDANGTAEELREAAHILNQIAEVLEDNGK